MKLSIATLLVGATAVSASDSIRANSKMGRSLMSKARHVGGSRQLEQGDDGTSWVANYSLRFEKCATTTDYYGGYFGGDDNQGGNDNNNNNRYNLYEQRLVHFKLCPSDTCGKGCSGGGDYVVDMNEFVMSYIEYKEELKEAQCETAIGNCQQYDCNNANDDEVNIYYY